MAARGVAPIVTTEAWRAAVQAADGQCQHSAKSGRCTHTLNGGYRLYLDDDGKVYCSDHGPRRTVGAAPEPEGSQDSLF